jgi:hypothetical protein
MPGNAPDAGEKLAHCGNKGDFTRLTVGHQTVRSMQPRIESHSSQDRHPKRLSQLCITQANYGRAGKALLTRLSQSRGDADVTSQCRCAVETSRITEFSDEIGGCIRSYANNRRA